MDFNRAIDAEQFQVHPTTSTNTTMNIALIGSSGGGVATTGHTDPVHFICTIQQQLECISCSLIAGYYIVLDYGIGIDSSNPSIDTATLYEISTGTNHSNNSNSSNSNINAVVPATPNTSSHDLQLCHAIFHGTLHQVNEFIVMNELDSKLASLIRTPFSNSVTSIDDNDENSTISTNSTGRSRIDGLITVSCNVQLFQCTFQTASLYKIPVTGSGGTSIGQAASLYNVQFIGNSGGSVATTSNTRAVSYTASFAKYYKRNYNDNNNNDNFKNTFQSTTTPTTITSFRSCITILKSILVTLPSTTISLVVMHRSTLNSSLPIFWTICLLKKIVIWTLRISTADADVQRRLLLTTTIKTTKSTNTWETLSLCLQAALFGLENYALPVSCCIYTAMQAANTSSSRTTTKTGPSSSAAATQATTLISAVLCTCLISYRSVLTGLVIGSVANTIFTYTMDWIIFQCIIQNIPATMTSILSVFASIVCFIFVSIVFLFPLSILLRNITSFGRVIIYYACTATTTVTGTSNTTAGSINTLVNMIRLGFVGMITGAWSCYGSKVGWYHSYHLPIMLAVEMELGDYPSLGAVDELSLVLVCAGICTANMLLHRWYYCPTASNTSSISSNSIRSSTGTSNKDDNKDSRSSNSSKPIISPADASICGRGLLINLLFGDFVEVCYPYMDNSVAINWSGYIASGLSCSCYLILSSRISTIDTATTNVNITLDGTDNDGMKTTTIRPPTGMAYFPLPLSILIATDPKHWFAMIVSCCIALGIPLITTLIDGYVRIRSQQLQTASATVTTRPKGTDKQR